jgi:hypothetical protein
LSRKPRAVELGFMLWGSETDRREGTLRGRSLGLLLLLLKLGSSRGVLASEDSSEPGEVGVARSFGVVPSYDMAARRRTSRGWEYGAAEKPSRSRETALWVESLSWAANYHVKAEASMGVGDRGSWSGNSGGSTAGTCKTVFQMRFRRCPTLAEDEGIGFWLCERLRELGRLNGMDGWSVCTVAQVGR